MGIKESALSVIASLTDSDFIRAVTAAGESRKIQATGVGKYAVETYSGSTLAGSAQSVQSAVGGLKNDITTISGDLITLQGDIATLNTNLINKLKKSLIVGTASGSIASFNNGSDIFPALKCVAKIEPNQDTSGGNPSPSNICPISGWSGVDVYDDPKHGGIIEWNQQLRELDSTYWKGSTSLTPTNIVFSNNSVSFNPSASGSYVDMYSANYITRLVGHKYLLVAEMYAEGGGEISVLYSKGTGNSQLRTSNSSWTLLGAMWEQTSESKNIQLRCSTYVANMVSHYRNVMLFDLTEMFGSTIADYIYSLEQNNAGAGVAYFKNLFPKDYYAYNAGTETCVSAVNGDTYKKVTVSWSGDAGTVYGGTVDVVSGELTVTHASITLTDFSAWGYQATNHYKALLKRADQIGIPMPNTSSEARSAVICSAFNNELDGRDKPYGTFSLYASNDGTFYFWNNDDVASDKNDMISRLEAIQPQIVYELATPTTYTLTAQQVDILLGDNNIFANTGPMDPVEYYADATITIQNLS